MDFLSRNACRFSWNFDRRPAVSVYAQAISPSAVTRLRRSPFRATASLQCAGGGRPVRLPDVEWTDVVGGLDGATHDDLRCGWGGVLLPSSLVSGPRRRYSCLSGLNNRSGNGTGSAVAIRWGDAGTSAYVYPFT